MRRVRISAGKPVTLTEVIRNLSLFVEANSGIVPYIGPRSLPCTSVEIQYTLPHNHSMPYSL
jgi:hypothetical protein